MVSRLENIINFYIFFILSVALWPFLSYLGIGFIDGILKNFSLLCMFNFLLITMLRDMRKRHLGNILYSLRYIIILIVLIALSSLWSINKSTTIKNSIYLILTTIYAIYIYMNYSLKDFIRIMTKVIFTIALLSIIIVTIFPEYGMNMYPSWNGIYSQKNTLGRMMVVGSICSYFYMKIYINTNRYKFTFGLVTLMLCIINLIFSASMTSIMSLVIILIICKFFKFKNKVISLIFFIFAFISVTIFIVKPQIFATIFEFLGKDVNFTGRTDIWNICIDRIRESNFMGYGFFASWDPQYMYNFQYYKSYMTNAHNGILQLALDFGLVGTIVYVCTFTSALVKNSVNFYKNKHMNMGLFCILLYIFISNFFESLTIQSFSILWIIQLISILHVNNKKFEI